MALAAVLASGCGGGLGPGDEIVADLGRDMTLDDVMPDAVETFYAEGRPVEGDFRCATHALSRDGILVIDAESDDFDPVLAVVDKEGALITMCDDWDGSVDARLALSELPSGAVLLVFSVDGSGGEYQLTVTEGTQKDLEDFTAARSLDSGTVTAEKCDDKDDDQMNDALSDDLDDWLYLSDYSGAVIHPFTVSEDVLCSVTLESEDFDPILAIVEIDDDEYDYVASSDDVGYGLNSRVDQVLDAGRYGAVVMSYDPEEDGDYTLTLQTFSSDAIEPVFVEADSPGMLFSGTIAQGMCLAAGVWPALAEEKPYELQLSAASPCALFRFEVSPGQTGIYDIDAGSDNMDVILTLLAQDGETVRFLAFNDDFGSSTASRVTWALAPGTYVALVSSYDEGATGDVDFSFQPSQAGVTQLLDGRTSRGEITWDNPRLNYTFEIVAGRTYTVAADAITAADGTQLDPYIEAILPDGTLLTDDDGGGYPNSLIRISPTPQQYGNVLLVVRGLYTESVGTVDVLLTEGRMSEGEAFSLYD